MLLAQEPKLLLVDEPAAGMTLGEREHTSRRLVELAKNRAVVVVEHDMDFVRWLNCKVACVMGTNGVGKASLLKAMAGTYLRSGGEVAIGGVSVGPGPPQIMAQRGLAYVPQGRMIFPLLTVRENLEPGFALLPRADHRVPDEIYQLFPVLKDMAGRRGGDLSGGQQQLSIARALIVRPKVLLMDEPTEGSQPNVIQDNGRVIKYLKDKGEMAIVLVEQYFDFAYDPGDAFYVLNRGAGLSI